MNHGPPLGGTNASYRRPHLLPRPMVRAVKKKSRSIKYVPFRMESKLSGPSGVVKLLLVRCRGLLQCRKWTKSRPKFLESFSTRW